MWKLSRYMSTGMNINRTQNDAVNSRSQKISGLSDLRCMKYAATIDPFTVATTIAMPTATATADRWRYEMATVTTVRTISAPNTLRYTLT